MQRTIKFLCAYFAGKLLANFDNYKGRNICDLYS